MEWYVDTKLLLIYIYIFPFLGVIFIPHAEAGPLGPQLS